MITDDQQQLSKNYQNTIIVNNENVLYSTSNLLNPSAATTRQALTMASNVWPTKP
jgi:hypothetical protein